MTKYTVETWDHELEAFTPQEGLDVPAIDVDVHGLRRALRALQQYGYACNRQDPSVLVRRLDDAQTSARP